MGIQQGNFKKKVAETIFFPMRGLRSLPAYLTPPDCLADTKNFVFKTEGNLISRPGIIGTELFSTSTTPLSIGVVFQTTATTNESIFYPKGKELYLYTEGDYDSDSDSFVTSITGVSATGVTVGTSFFTSTTGFKDGCRFLEQVFLVEGTSIMTRYDGNSVRTTYFPDTATWGNPISICNQFSRLFVVTDKGYVRYSETNDPDVWEERTLQGGTVSCASGTTLVTGVNTYWLNFQLQEGVNIYLYDGVNEQRATINKVESNVRMFLNTASSTSITNGALYITSQFAEPVDVQSSVKPKMIRGFSNYLAISMSGSDTYSSESSIVYLRAQQFENRSLLLIDQKKLGQGFTVHPYSLCEYEGSLLFVCSNGIYMVPPYSIFSEQNIQPILISKEKLENYFAGDSTLDPAYTRTAFLRNSKFNLILVSTGKVTGTAQTDRDVFCGFRTYSSNDSQYDFEFTRCQIPSYGLPVLTPFKASLMIADQFSVYKWLNNFNHYNLDTSRVAVQPRWSSVSYGSSAGGTIYVNSSCDDVVGVGQTGAGKITTSYDDIYDYVMYNKSISTGMFSYGMNDTFKAHKYFWTATEKLNDSPAGLQVTAATYKVGLGVYDLRADQSVDDVFGTNLVSTYIRTIPVENADSTTAVRIPVWANANYLNTAHFYLYADGDYIPQSGLNDSMVIQFRGWGLSHSPSKFI